MEIIEYRAETYQNFKLTLPGAFELFKAYSSLINIRGVFENAILKLDSSVKICIKIKFYHGKINFYAARERVDERR